MPCQLCDISIEVCASSCPIHVSPLVLYLPEQMMMLMLYITKLTDSASQAYHFIMYWLLMSVLMNDMGSAVTVMLLCVIIIHVIISLVCMHSRSEEFCMHHKNTLVV